MNVLMHLPTARAKMGGGAISMWRTAEALMRRGVPVRVSASAVQSRRVRDSMVRVATGEDLRWADVIVTVSSALRMMMGPGARSYRKGKPLVCFVHTATRPVRVIDPSFMVWASAAIRARAITNGYRPTGCPDMVFWPPIDADSIRVDQPGPAVTLVNLQVEKGAKLFYDVAKLLPDVPFLGVRGGWGKQYVPNRLPKNVTVAPYATDPRRVYSRTKVLLYLRGPNAGPNWLQGVGMAALEAAVSGIPTIAHPGAGLLESLDFAGTFVDSDDPVVWAAAVREVLDPSVYAARSRLALMRAGQLDPEGDLDRLIEAMESLVARRERVA